MDPEMRKSLYHHPKTNSGQQPRLPVGAAQVAGARTMHALPAP